MFIFYVYMLLFMFRMHIYKQQLSINGCMRTSNLLDYLSVVFLSWNKKNYVYPCKLQFYYIKVELKGVKII